jgi:large subunit ribosomal protein L4
LTFILAFLAFVGAGGRLRAVLGRLGFFIFCGLGRVGGVYAHGPRARVFASSLNKKVRALGLKMALSSKAKEGNLLVLDNLDVAEGKTKTLKEQLGKLGFGKTALVIDGDALNVSFARASSNLGTIDLLPAVGANVYDIMRHETLVLTRAGLEKLEDRFNG